jgi:DNA-binding LacI/PurR family transcriptional regulator
MPVTINDIAKEAEVSHSTVFRAPRGSSLISKKNTNRIHDTALQLGYFPTAAALRLKKIVRRPCASL